MLQEIKEDFEFIKDKVKGVLIFGSAARGELSKRSDVDICLIRPKYKRILFKVFEKLGNKYDVKIFENLPLHIKMNIIKEHVTVFGDEVELSYYFYRFRKEWKDMEHRIEKNRFKSAKEITSRRKAWLNERKMLQKA